MPETATNTAEDFIGLDELYIAEVTSDDERGYVVGVPERFAPAASMSKETAAEQVNTYYDNGVYRTLSSEDADTLTLGVPALTLAMLAKITGKTIDPITGAFIDSGEPVAKNFAFFARAQLSDYTYRYFVWHKVSFAVPNEEVTTKGESVEPTGQELTMTAVRTQFKYDIGGQKKGVKRIIADERDGKVDFTKWYTQVPVPGNIPAIAQE